jgi:hypothetical protein
MIDIECNHHLNPKTDRTLHARSRPKILQKRRIQSLKFEGFVLWNLDLDTINIFSPIIFSVNWQTNSQSNFQFFYHFSGLFWETLQRQADCASLVKGSEDSKT